MLDRTAAFDAAIIGCPRHIFVRAIVDISDPDKEWLPATGSPQAPWSRAEELHDRIFDPPPRYSTLERGRWLLDGSFDLFPDDYQVPEPVGRASAAMSGGDGLLSVWEQVNFKMSVLQAFSMFFSTDPLDGVPYDFTVEVIQGGTAYFSKEITGNTAAALSFDGFTVYNPDCIRVTVTRWTLPCRRERTVEILPGVFEDWDADMLESFLVTMQGQFSCLSLPYGTAEIAMDNKSRRFEPRRKDGLFQSIEERQGIELFLGVLLASRAVEYKGLGTFYHAPDGWRDGDNSMAMSWSLVDIVGLVAERNFQVPDVLPTTLAGWLAAVVAQFGPAFKNRYHADPDYADLPVTAGSREAVSGKKCKDIIRWACQVTGTWPRADQATGRLTAEPLWNQGTKVTLDNLTSYARMQANRSYAALIFTLTDGTMCIIPGNSTSAEESPSIVNPFIHTEAQARTAARLILAQYGGNIIETTGRGNPASEIGDVDTIWLDESTATTARRMMQTFEIRDGALQGCGSKLLQADGSYLWTGFEVITESRRYKAPPGVGQLRIVIGQAGQGGGYGQNGSRGAVGDPGQDGQGGMVWYGVIDINPEQEFDVVLGQGGAPGAAPGQDGQMGGHTTFGPYSSENGQRYPGGYTDIANGQAFARAGVAAPLPGTGDGGKGGEGGTAGVGYWETVYWTSADVAEGRHPGTALDGSSIVGKPKGKKYVEIEPPGPGSPGVAGAAGFVMVTWDKPEKENAYV